MIDVSISRDSQSTQFITAPDRWGTAAAPASTSADHLSAAAAAAATHIHPCSGSSDHDNHNNCCVSFFGFFFWFFHFFRVSNFASLSLSFLIIAFRKKKKRMMEAQISWFACFCKFRKKKKRNGFVQEKMDRRISFFFLTINLRLSI